jgi:glycosyltransferase involved in cell wall biosynthesis
VKVLFLAHSFPRFAGDPVGSFVLRLAVALREQDVESRVIAPGAAGLPAREELEGIPVLRYRYAPRKLETLAYAGTMKDQVGRSWGARLALAGMIAGSFGMALGAAQRFNPDVIHAHWWFPGGLVGGWVAGFRRIPLVTTLHGSDLRIAQQSAFAGRIARGVFRRSARVTTVSRWLAVGVTAVAPGVTPVVGPMPVVADLFYPDGKRDRDRLLFVGKLNEQKGIIHLLQAMARMQREAALDVVVGVGSDATAARALAANLGLAGRVQWHPLLSQAELAKMYRRATVLVVPSVEEGLGLVAVEALLSETPVVAFESGGLPDVVVHGVTGLLVQAERSDLLAEALDEILGRPDQGASLGKAGRRHALGNFSPSAVAARYREVYNAALASRA